MRLRSRHLGTLLTAFMLAVAVLLTGCGGGGGGAGGGGDRTGATVTGQVRIYDSLGQGGQDMGPAANASVKIGEIVAIANSSGQFTLENVPVSAKTGSIEGFVGDGTNGWYPWEFTLPPLIPGQNNNLGTVKVRSNSGPPDPPPFPPPF